jgi:hypothetical protein
MIAKLWQEVVIQDAFKNLPHGLPDTTAYFMNSSSKYLTNGYSPTNEDILNLRTVTQTVSDTIFDVKGKKIHFIDVSGRNG